MGVVAVLTGNQRLSIVALTAFFIGGAWLLSRVPLSRPDGTAATAP
jgi:hypothetical protein